MHKDVAASHLLQKAQFGRGVIEEADITSRNISTTSKHETKAIVGQKVQAAEPSPRKRADDNDRDRQQYKETFVPFPSIEIPFVKHELCNESQNEIDCDGNQRVAAGKQYAHIWRGLQLHSISADRREEGAEKVWKRNNEHADEILCMIHIPRRKFKNDAGCQRGQVHKPQDTNGPEDK